MSRSRATTAAPDRFDPPFLDPALDRLAIRPDEPLTQAELLSMYRAMRLSRTFENKLSALYRQGKIVGAVYERSQHSDWKSEKKIAAGSSLYFQLDLCFVVEPTCFFNFVWGAYLPFGKYSRYPKAWQIINRLSESEFYLF